jgi:hypothetical protein
MDGKQSATVGVTRTLSIGADKTRSIGAADAPAASGSSSRRRGAASAAAATPDLQILDARRSARNPNVLEVLVANTGQGAAGRSKARLVCARSEGGSESWDAPVPPIAASGRRWVKTSPAKAKPARTRVQGCEIRVDVADAVLEADETNNDFACATCGEASGGR